MDACPPVKQRVEILRFAAALGSQDRALRRDECGDWRINGRKGHIYATSEGFQIIVAGWSTKGWNAAKRALSFCRLGNDGDEEGVCHLDRLPSLAEANSIRRWCAIPKRMEFSPEALARKRAQALMAGTFIGKKTASDHAPTSQEPEFV